MRRFSLHALLVLGVMLSYCPGAQAEGQDSPSDVAPALERGSESQRRFGDGRVLAERLERQLDEMDREAARLEERRALIRHAIGRLDEGEAPASILRELQRELRDDQSDGAEGDWRGRGRNGPAMDRQPPFSPAEFVEMVKRRRPGLGERLEAIRAIDPERFDREFVERADHWREAVRDPEKFEQRLRVLESEIEIRRIAMSIDPASEEDRARAAEELRPLIAAQFDSRRGAAADRLERVRAHAERLEEMLAEVDAKRSEFIERRVEEILEGRAPRRGGDDFGRGRRVDDPEGEGMRGGERGDRPGRRERDRR